MNIKCAVIGIFLVGVSSPIMADGDSVFSSPYLGVYPDITVTINNGSGVLKSTTIIAYTDNSCFIQSGPEVDIGGHTFSYISGNAYKANLKRAYSLLFSQSASHVAVIIVDSNSAKAQTGCMSYVCSSAQSCTFSPTTQTATF